MRFQTANPSGVFQRKLFRSSQAKVEVLSIPTVTHPAALSGSAPY